MKELENKMDRTEAVELMTSTVDEFNRYQAEQQGIDSEQVEQYIAAARDQMVFVNGMLYDTLKANGVIN
jgi:hypothetical protein